MQPSLRIISILLAAEGHFHVPTIPPLVTSQLTSSLVKFEKLDKEPPKPSDSNQPLDPSSWLILDFISGILGSINNNENFF